MFCVLSGAAASVLLLAGVSVPEGGGVPALCVGPVAAELLHLPSLFLFPVLAIVHRLLEAFDGPTEVCTDGLQLLRAENEERDGQDDQKLFHPNTHGSTPA